MANKVKSENWRRVRANGKFCDMPNYHNALPLADIDAILESEGFQPLEEAIYCGRDGRMRQQVGPKTWLAMSWHKMEETGRYEVVAYLS